MDEVDDVAVDEAVGDIAGDAADEEDGGGGADSSGEPAFEVEDNDADECGDGDAAEEVVGPGGFVADAEGDTGVVDADDFEPVGDDVDASDGRWGVEIAHDPEFGDLVEDEQGDRDEEKWADHGEARVWRGAASPRGSGRGFSGGLCGDGFVASQAEA